MTEDFELSVGLHERGWRSRYVPEVLARGLGPEDMASYVSQQHRWAAGCIGAIPRGAALARCRCGCKLQYCCRPRTSSRAGRCSSTCRCPSCGSLTGAQPLAGATADEFLAHFAPYFGLSLAPVASVGGGAYTFAAFSLATSSFWVHVQATLRCSCGGRAASS